MNCYNRPLSQWRQTVFESEAQHWIRERWCSKFSLYRKLFWSGNSDTNIIAFLTKIERKMSKDTQCAKKEAVSKKNKRSLGRQCSAYQYYSTFYTTDGAPTGLHFIRFWQKYPEKRRWWNLIKRDDGMDGFKVTHGTVLCEKHFTAADIKRNPNCRRLVSGAVPSQNLYQSSVTKMAFLIIFWVRFSCFFWKR